MNIKKRNKNLKFSNEDHSYAQVLVHQAMIKDRARTLAYKRAIEHVVKSEDVVLDLGCGSGILSFFAVKKGCRKVYAVDRSNILDCAVEVAQNNGLEQKIVFIKKDVFLFIPPEKINVLIQEQIGSFIWEEDLMDKVSYVRDHLLVPGGRFLPYKIDISLVPSCCDTDLNRSMRFWSKKRFGIDFSVLRRKCLEQNIKQGLLPSNIYLKNTSTFLCEPKVCYSIDLRTEIGIPSQIKASFRLRKSSRLTGMCLFFRVHLDDKHSFSTAPSRQNNHWGQVFIPYVGEVVLKKDSTLEFSWSPAVKPRDWKFSFDLK